MDKEYEAILFKLVEQFNKGLLTEENFWCEVNYAKAKFDKVLV